MSTRAAAGSRSHATREQKGTLGSVIAGSDRRSHDRGEEAIPPDGGSARAADPRAETTRTLTIGYLQVGPIEHGICRYGRLVASEGRRRQGVVSFGQHTAST